MDGRIEEADELCATASGIFRGARKFQQMAPILLTRAKALAGRGDVVAAYGAASEAVEAAGKGADAVLQAMTCLDGAAFIASIAPRLELRDASAADQRAAEAATTAVALLHQRDYRFLLRTKEAAFSALRGDLLRWRVGHALFSDAAEARTGVPLRIEMLGGFDVLVDGHLIPSDAWKRRKARDIFAYLVNARGRAVPRARLADLYWSELDADAANDNLRVTISAIRKAVGGVVKFEADGYRFAPPTGTTIDRDAFDEHIERAREAVARGDRAAARTEYGAATELYRGDFLDGMDEGGWQWHERERLRAACLEALRWIASDTGEPEAARLALERLLEVAPFDLEAVKMHLDGLVREMRVAEARRDYADWRTRYRAAVGAEAPEIWEPFAAPA
jgi:DNA-binding SARP family transcriptional activator